MKTNLHFWSYLAQLFLELEMFQTKVVEKIKTHILCSKTFFRQSCRLWGNVEKYCTAGRAEDGNMADARCMLDAYGYTHTHKHTHTHTHAQNVMKAPHCYIGTYIGCLLSWYTHTSLDTHQSISDNSAVCKPLRISALSALNLFHVALLATVFAGGCYLIRKYVDPLVWSLNIANFTGTPGGAVRWRNAIQSENSRTRFPMVSLEYFIGIILPAALWPWGRHSL